MPPKINNEENEFWCEICKKAFDDKEALKKHKKQKSHKNRAKAEANKLIVRKVALWTWSCGGPLSDYIIAYNPEIGVKKLDMPDEIDSKLKELGGFFSCMVGP